MPRHLTLNVLGSFAPARQMNTDKPPNTLFLNIPHLGKKNKAKKTLAQRKFM
jgi:hypothetical protein